MFYGQDVISESETYVISRFNVHLLSYEYAILVVFFFIPEGIEVRKGKE